MFRSGTLLLTDEEFQRARQLGAIVEVYQQDDPLRVCGLIDKFNADIVTIAGTHFIRKNCQFLIS